MRVELVDPLAPPVWPDGVRVRTYAPDDARPLHELLVHAYRHGGGEVAPFDEWLPAMTGDSEFDPQLWFLAEAGRALAGSALCWTSAFVKDLVVQESWRRCGLGEALLRHAFAELRRRGATRVDLKVEAGNDGARRLYERVGMRVVD
jgi:ribosomal protein S18 acetylase RimI-like enzyme